MHRICVRHWEAEEDERREDWIGGLKDNLESENRGHYIVCL